MPKQAERPMPGLRSAMDRRNAALLEKGQDEIARLIHAELESGATVEDVARLASELYGDNDWFTRRVVSAARHMAATIKERA